jgi:hypothetical protein
MVRRWSRMHTDGTHGMTRYLISSARTRWTRLIDRRLDLPLSGATVLA